jgi:hypothetical protein
MARLHPQYNKGTPSECKAESGEWVVLDRYCNYSAFNGYHCTPSDYSSVKCLRCGAHWRTKADYVSGLRTATNAERLSAGTNHGG